MAKKKAAKTVHTVSKKREEILRAFKKKRILNLLSTLVIFGTAFFAVWYSNNRSSFPEDATRTAIIITICTVSLGALAFSLFNWRCPACGKHLGGSVDPGACRKCGYKFR